MTGKVVILGTVGHRQGQNDANKRERECVYDNVCVMSIGMCVCKCVCDEYRYVCMQMCV